MTDPINQDTPVAWMWEDSTGCIYMCADRPDAVEMAASVSAEAAPLYSSDHLDRMRERAERAEAERADEWRARREAEAGRDTALAVAASFKAERDALIKAAEPFSGETIKTWVDEHGWTAVAPSRDRICDWFGHSDFRALLTKLQDTSHD